MENVTQKNEKSISGAIKINEKEIGEHLTRDNQQADLHFTIILVISVRTSSPF